MTEKINGFLKTQLAIFQSVERFLEGPIDYDPLKAALSQEESSGQAGQGTEQNYVDFLLPLPEHLQPTEVGIPDPRVVRERRKEGGLDKQMPSHNKQEARKELSLKAAPKSKPSQRPQMGHKSKIVPRPGGYISHEE